MCGCPSVPFRSYCADHVWQVYREGTNQHRRRPANFSKLVAQVSIIFEQAVVELEQEGLDVTSDDSTSSDLVL